MKSTEIIIEETMNWVNRVVIGLNFCPFAAPVVTHDKLHVDVLLGEWETRFAGVVQECQLLDSSDQYETSLLVLPQIGDFNTYLQFLSIAEDLLVAQGYEGVYQLATFHPQYIFAEAANDDPANFTNRSPYPMLHVIPEASLEDAIANYPNVEQIPENNKNLARHKGLAAMQSLRNGCFVHPK